MAYDLSGQQLWHLQVGNERASRFGTASSPILYKDQVILTAGAESESMYAFDAKTGKEVWKAEAGSLSGSYSTPLIVTDSKGIDELLLAVTYELWSLNPETGKLKWYAETKVDTAACCSAIAADDVAYVIGGRTDRTQQAFGHERYEGKSSRQRRAVVSSFRRVSLSYRRRIGDSGTTLSGGGTISSGAGFQPVISPCQQAGWKPAPLTRSSIGTTTQFRFSEASCRSP